MAIKKLVIKNYKLFEDTIIELNPDMNIFVGNNDSGKSTILEVLSILTTGKLNGIAFERQLKANLFNKKTRDNYIECLSNEKPALPPRIILEAYFEEEARYKGTNNTLSEDITGINVTVDIDQDNSNIYKQMLHSKNIKDIPIELYAVSYCYFSGENVTFKSFPIKSIFIDTTRKDYVGVVNNFVANGITNTLNEEELTNLAIAYKNSRRQFHSHEIIKRLNESVKQNTQINKRNISIDLLEDEVDAWRKQMSIIVDNIPFENVGFGTQNTIKIELALRNDELQSNVILMEEPENNLSFSNMAQLISNISLTYGKQIFISTHSSYIANKLNLGNVHLIKSGKIIPFNQMSEETKKYFIKLPGYDTLRFLLSEKTILVEGPTDDLVIQRAYKDKYGRLPFDDGIDIIVVDSLAFKRYCEIANLIKKSVVIVTDNDGDIKKNILDKYNDYLNCSNIKFYYEENEQFNTIEPSVLNANSTNNITSSEFKSIISCNSSLMNRDYEGLLKFMIRNKTEWAFRVFESDKKIHYPKYIEEVISHFE